MSSTSLFRYCGQCGAPTAQRIPPRDDRERTVCTACGHIHYEGPRLLVLTAVFAERRLLLVRRGQEPYAGKLAVPGGYVEAGESLEGAAIRETHEEAGVVLERPDLLPFAHLSLPAINQVYVVFVAQLPQRVPLRPAPPESLEAGWFLQEELPLDQLWAPALDFDLGLVFARGCSDRFDFYQRTDDSMRMISEGTRIRHIWPPR